MTLRQHARNALLVAMTLLLTSCGFDIYKVPLPGGAEVGDDPMTVTVTFTDVLDLVPQSTVKVNDVTVGRVSDIELDGYRAKVELTLRNDVDLAANAVATIRQTSLLGEKFVSLENPAKPVAQRLEDGAEIGLENAGRNVEVEEVLGAMSLVLNGGGVAQLKLISSELNKALKGRESSARSVLSQVETFMGELDENKSQIVTAIERLNKLSISANNERDTINAALDELPDAVASLDGQREDLVKMLGALDELGRTGTRVIKASKAGTVDTLKLLQPVLAKLAESGDSFAEAFHVFLTYPFVDEAVGRDPQTARNLHMGDFVNLSVKLDIRLLDTSGTGLLPALLPDEIDPAHVVNDVLTCLGSGSLSSPSCKRVIAVPGNLLQLFTLCAQDKNQDKLVCGLLSPILNPAAGGGLLQLSRGADTTAGSGAAQKQPKSGAKTSKPSSGQSGAGSEPKSDKNETGLSKQLQDLLGTLGLNRANPTLGVSLSDLEAGYDPTLVRLLLRGAAR